MFDIPTKFDTEKRKKEREALPKEVGQMLAKEIKGSLKPRRMPWMWQRATICGLMPCNKQGGENREQSLGKETQSLY